MAMGMVNDDDETDHELPELAIQRIQSFMSTKDAARSCLLSKPWLRSLSTHPCLDFDQSLLFPAVDPKFHWYNKSCTHKYRCGIKRVRTKFADLVNTTLVRYTTQKLRIRKFRLSATMLNCKHSSKATADRIDEWIRLAFESGTVELHLLLSSHTLPEKLLFSATSLEVLHLTRCNFRHQNHPVLVDFYNLKSLVLHFVYIDDHTIASIISGIPLVENIEVRACKGFTKIKVSNLDHLKGLKFISSGKNQIFHIEAPNLESFTFSSLPRSRTEPPLFYMNASSKLKKLHLLGASITDKQFDDLVRQCVVIEELGLSDCSELESINISGRSLTSLLIRGCRKLVSVTIDAPNLRWFFCSCDTLGTSISVVNYSPSKSWPLGCLYVRGCRNLNRSWFLQLRSFLKNINHKVSSLSVNIKSSNQNCFSSAKAHSYLPEVADLMVTIEALPSSSIRYPALLDGLFWSLRPTKRLIITWRGTNSDKESRAFSRFLRKKLVVEESSKTNWWQCIKDGESCAPFTRS